MISWIFEGLCVLWFKITGWQVGRSFPEGLKKYVLIVAPHTSNWDFPIGVAARKILKLNVKYVAKKELFKFPIGGMLKGLGGFPVDRSKSNSFVEAVVEHFNALDEFGVCITPEGTRSRVDKWKTGFYHMAIGAKVPVIMVGFDYPTKCVVVSDPLALTGEMDTDLNAMHRFFKQITPKYPELSQYHRVGG
jgi:1-acyl-sn-glycerol-3-phosphate acyltransferase